MIMMSLVFADAVPANLAYTAGALDLHTDLPYMRSPPDVRGVHSGV